MGIRRETEKEVRKREDGEERKNHAENALEVEGNRVRLHFTVESLRELSEEAIQERKPFSITEEELSYSNDPELFHVIG